MICYPVGITETEIPAINDYWLQSENSPTGFFYTLKDINERHQKKKIKPISVLAKDSSFLPHSHQKAFTCENCKRKKPARNRKNFSHRIKSSVVMICGDCETSLQKQARKEARQIIEEYKAEKIKTKPYIDTLGFIESLSLLTLLSDHTNDGYYIGDSYDDITVTGVPTLDHQLLHTLINKDALVHLETLPEEVQKANAVIYGSSQKLSYHDRYKKSVPYRSPDSITTGIYLSPLYSVQYMEVSTIRELLYQRVCSHVASINDTKEVHQLVREIQLHKLFQLVIHVNQETRLAIHNSVPLQSLLNHLAENYPPNKLFYTFRIKAREAIECIYKDSVAPYIAKNYFAKFVGNYIQHVEDRGFELKKTWALPPDIKTSSFEAIFSEIYLNGHFDWNRLSAKEVVALWLNNIELSQDISELVSDN